MMVSKEEFSKYVKELLENDKDKKNINRLSKGYLAGAICSLVLSVVIFIRGFIYLANTNIINRTLLIIWILLLVLAIMMFVLRNKTKKYYNDNYRGEILNFLLKGYRYYFDPIGRLSTQMLEDSQFSKSFDYASTSDVLGIDIPEEDGSKSQVDMYIGDVYSYNIHIDEEGKRTTTGVYSGMFGYSEFPYNFKCILTINSKYKRKGLKLEKVHLEDIVFNDIFDVYSDNQIEARYILTPDMMTKLMNLQKKIKNIKISFVDNCLFVGAKGFNMFELDYLKEDNPVTVFENLYDEIEIVLSIVNEIKNNNKIFVTQRKKRKKRKLQKQ